MPTIHYNSGKPGKMIIPEDLGGGVTFEIRAEKGRDLVSVYLGADWGGVKAFLINKSELRRISDACLAALAELP